MAEGNGHRAASKAFSVRRFCPRPLRCAVALSAAAAEGGTLRGRIKLHGKRPGNRVIRMGMDPDVRDS